MLIFLKFLSIAMLAVLAVYSVVIATSTKDDEQALGMVIVSSILFAMDACLIVYWWFPWLS